LQRRSSVPETGTFFASAWDPPLPLKSCFRRPIAGPADRSDSFAGGWDRGSFIGGVICSRTILLTRIGAALDRIWPSGPAPGSDRDIDLNLKRNGVTPFELALANAECAAIKRKRAGHLCRVSLDDQGERQADGTGEIADS
jgi:hypothetical protein